MIGVHLPALQVVLPLIVAPLCALVRRGILAWTLALAVSLVLPIIALTLLAQVRTGEPISYMMGNWAAPYGIEYRIDEVNALLLVLVSGIGAVVMVYARKSVAAEIPARLQGWYYTMYLLCLSGLLGVTITGDAFNIFVFLEISSLSSYVLIAMGRDRRALTAAYQYLIMGTIGATCIVIGVGLLYTMTGTLNLLDLAGRVAEVGPTRPILVALAFLTVGISLKLALFPLHFWLPNAYAYAPSVASAFLAATATKVAVYLLLRFIFSVFGPTLTFPSLPLPEIILSLSILAFFAASLVAVFQENVKRMLAFSSVAQIGYITLGIGIANETGLTGAIVHLFNHALMKGGLFLLIGCVALRLGSVTIDDLAGLGRRMPLTAAGIVVACLSMIGAPGTVGFVSKWYLAQAALERGWWWLVVIIVLSSLVTLIYVGRIVEAAYFREPACEAQESPLSMLIPALFLVALCVYFGLYTELSVDNAARAAAVLMQTVR